MNWDATSAIAELLGAVGVIAWLGLQLPGAARAEGAGEASAHAAVDASREASDPPRSREPEAPDAEELAPSRPSLKDRLIGDYKRFYSLNNAAYLTVGFGVGAALASTSADEKFRRRYQEDWRNDTTDDFSKVFKTFGEWQIWLPIYAGVTLLGNERISGDTFGPLGVWGERSLRTVLLGTPPLLLLQRTTGGGRPTDGNGSGWDFWADANGVSGHAFIGAIPFLTAAGMVDFWPARWILYGLSTFTAWSRVNDDAHFLSQASLGWFLAWRTVRSVEAADQVDEPQFAVVPMGDGAAVIIMGRF